MVWRSWGDLLGLYTVDIRSASVGSQEKTRQAPPTPSTRPSTASTRSCSTPELIQNLATLSSLPMGKALGLDDMDDVAKGIRSLAQADFGRLSRFRN